jgi:hypothetical protein
MVNHNKVRVLHGCGMLSILIGLIVAGIVVQRRSSAVIIRLVDEPSRMEVNGVRRTRTEASAFLDKINCHTLRRVELIGFEQGTARQVSRAYDLLSEHGYQGRVTFIFADQKIMAWIYPIEDHHHENRLSNNSVIDILLDREGVRLGSSIRIRQFVEYPTNGAPRYIEGESRVRIYDSVVYDAPDNLLAAINLDNVPKCTPIEIMCEDALLGLPILQMLKAMSLLGFDNIYVAFF